MILNIKMLYYKSNKHTQIFSLPGRWRNYIHIFKAYKSVAYKYDSKYFFLNLNIYLRTFKILGNK